MAASPRTRTSGEAARSHGTSSSDVPLSPPSLLALRPGTPQSPRGPESPRSAAQRGVNAAAGRAGTNEAAGAGGAKILSPLYKTELCRSFEETGVCKYGGKCQFAHGREDLRTVLRHPKYKTEVCRTFSQSGACPYGSRCRFIHRATVQIGPGGAEAFPAQPATLAEVAAAVAAGSGAASGAMAALLRDASPASLTSSDDEAEPCAAHSREDSPRRRLPIFRSIAEPEQEPGTPPQPPLGGSRLRPGSGGSGCESPGSPHPASSNPSPRSAGEPRAPPAPPAAAARPLEQWAPLKESLHEAATGAAESDADAAADAAAAAAAAEAGAEATGADAAAAAAEVAAGVGKAGEPASPAAQARRCSQHGRVSQSIPMQRTTSLRE